MIRGRSVSVQALSDHPVENVYALPRRDSLSRSGVHGSRPWSASRSSVMEDGRRSGILLQFAGITADGEMKLTSVGLPVPIWATS